MECIVCNKSMKGIDAEHIAINEEGEPVVMCDEFYDKVRVFFEEVKHHGKGNS